VTGYCDEGDHFLRLLRFLRSIGGGGLEPWAGGWIGCPMRGEKTEGGTPALPHPNGVKDLSVSVYLLPGKESIGPEVPITLQAHRMPPPFENRVRERLTERKKRNKRRKSQFRICLLEAWTIPATMLIGGQTAVTGSMPVAKRP
jgi:hypothetical protein